MANYVENFNNKLDWAMPFQRTGKFPIDRTDLFSSYADAVKYAAGNTSDPDSRGLCGTSYVGQIITVIENDVVTVYKIKADRTLAEVGSSTSGDGQSIDLGDGNVLSLKNFGRKYYKYVPATDTTEATYQLIEDGTFPAGLQPMTRSTDEGTIELAWYEPSYYSKSEIDDLLAAISTINISVVSALPTENISSSTIYLVAKTTAGTNDVYDEYIYVASTSSWEKIGTTSVNLNDYLQTNGDGSSVTVAFTEAATRALPATGETLSVILGKIVKYLSSLSSVAFSGNYFDLTNAPKSAKYSTETLTAGTTSKTITVENTNKIVSISVIDATTLEEVLCDISYGSGRHSATVSIAAAHTNDLEITATYI